ncbi:uncharacterized protein [Primulina huaijiensis]|uniref:uncharacterized protein n=1 Tax=Primulina huaijiensis TaxID=1492673 RepID=UPI003CC78B50
MEDEILKSLRPMVNVADDVERNEAPTKKIKAEIDRTEKEEKEAEDAKEITLEGGFIQKEKELFDVKDCNHNTETISFADKRPTVVEHTDWNPEKTRELLESEEKVEELEDDLVTMSDLLKDSEFENMNLKKELLLSNKCYQESVDKHEEIFFERERMLEHNSKAEVRHKLELKIMQDALKAQERKNKELTDVKEAFDCLSLDLRTSRKDMEDLKLDLQIYVDEAGRFEELHQQSSSFAASETKKALELEGLLKLAKASAIEMQNQMVTLQDELKNLYESIAENQNVEEILKRTSAELSAVQGGLELSQSQVQDLKRTLASKEARICELTQELELASVAEFKANEEISSFENLMSSTKESLQEKVSHLEDVKLKLKEKESYAKQLEEHLKNHETKMKIMQEELAKSNIEVELEDAVTDQAQIKEFYDDLEDKLRQSDEKFCKTDYLFSQAMAKSKELEQKLKTLEVVALEEKNITGKEIEELTQRFASEGQKLQSQISAVLEESNLLHKTCKSSNKDLHTVIDHLKEHLKEKKSNKYASKARMEGEGNKMSTRALSTNTPIHGTEGSSCSARCLIRLFSFQMFSSCYSFLLNNLFLLRNYLIKNAIFEAAFSHWS